jgi:predicted nuclease of predicted toxin-antitoxin system
MKFLVDMALSPKTAKFLVALGYEAERVDKLGMAKSKDREIFEFAIGNNRVVITADMDFGHILAHTKSNKPSVIIFRLKQYLRTVLGQRQTNSFPAL